MIPARIFPCFVTKEILPDNIELLYCKKLDFLTMSLSTIRCICAILCLWSGQIFAVEISDPFRTEESLPHKPSLRQYSSDPCAKTAKNNALNLLEVVNLALCNNPQTRAAWANARAQAAQVGVSKASYLPSNSLTVSDSRSRVNAAPSIYQRSIGFNISYLLYDFGERAANLENARKLLDAATAAQDSTVQAVFFSAVQAYYQTHATLAALLAARESERAAKESFAAAEARYIAGSATPADKLQAQTAYSQAMLNRIAADGNMKIAKGTLASILGLDASQNVLLAEADGFSVMQNSFVNGHGKPIDSAGNAVQKAEAEALIVFERDVVALIEEARQRRPDLYAAAAQVKAAEASVDAARAAGKPSISLTASINQSNSAGVTSRGSTAGIMLSVPIFSGFAPTYRIRAAEAQVESQNAQFERLRLQVALDVWTAYQNLITATQTLRSTADLLNSAVQSDQVALGRYKAGVGNILDVLNAQSALASARQQRVQATFSWNISRAALAQAMGSLDADLLQALPDSAYSKP